MRLARLLVAFVLLAPGAAAGPEDDALGALVAEMGGQDQTRRYPAYQALSSRKDPKAIPILLQALPDFDVSAQSYGVSLLHAYPDDLARPAWRKLTTAQRPYLRVSAAAVLLREGDTKVAGVIVETLSRTDVETGEMTMLLGQLYGVKDPAVLGALRALVASDRESAVLTAALYQLQSADDPGSDAAIERLLAHAEAGVRAVAAASLLKRGQDQRAVELAAALRTGEVSYAEFSRMTSVLSSAPHVADDVLAAAAEQLDRVEEVYHLAAIAGFLGRFKYGKAAPALRKLLDHEHETVSKAAFEALSAIPGAITSDGLRELLGAKDPARRLAAAEALRRADDHSGLPAVLELSAKGSPQRREAVRVLATYRVRAAVDPLIDALEDEDLTVRAHAWNGLDEVLRTLFPYRRLDMTRLGYVTSGDPASRAVAVRTLRTWWEAARTKGW